MRASEAEALREFYVGSRQQLYTYAVSITGNRESAEDAIHSAFEHLLQRAFLPAELRPYAFRCVRNAALDGLRRNKVRRDSIFDPSDAQIGDPLHSGFGPGELEQWLLLLSPDEREAIVLKVYNDFSFQQISDLRDAPLPTVASWYRRGLEKLRMMMAKDFK
jgi:RNA polymerase sigma-70 factor (ECF subfamily)